MCFFLHLRTQNGKVAHWVLSCDPRRNGEASYHGYEPLELASCFMRRDPFTQLKWVPQTKNAHGNGHQGL